MAQFVDWDLAAATAGALSKSGPRVSYAEATDVVGELRRLTEEAAGHVADYTGLRSQVAHPPVRVVDRRDWAADQHRRAARGDHPAGEPALRRQAAGRADRGDRLPADRACRPAPCWRTSPAGCSASTRSSPADPGQLLLVAPNIVEVERKLGADPRDFRLWVCLHEVTHRTQFTAVPWMRAYFLGEVQAFVDASPGRRAPARAAAARGGHALRRGQVTRRAGPACWTSCRPRRSGPCWTGSPR